MIPAFAPRPATRDHNVLQQPGRTRAHPAEECCHALRTHCIDDKELSPNGIRVIGTAVTKLSECKLLHMVDEELIQRYLQIQHSELSKPNPVFPFDMVEISLKFLAASDMPIRLYRDEYLRLIVEKLHSLCVTSLFENSEKTDELYRLCPLLRHLAHIVEQCAFPDPAMIDLCSIGIRAFFLQTSSQSLQSASCSLLTSVFRRYQPFRVYIIDEVFSILPKSQGSSRFLSVSNGSRISISAPSRLFLELVQSICSFPMDVESVVKELIRIIIERFFRESKTATVVAKLFERFTEDVGKCLTHPFCPIASLVLKSLLEFFFPLVTKKDRLSRLAIKMLCPALDVITACFHQSKEEIAIAIPLLLLQSLADFDDETIRTCIVLPDSHFLIDNESIVLKIDATFPSNKLEKLTSDLIICLYIRQSFKLSDLINTSLPYHIANWSINQLSQEEMDNYLVWWHGTFPDTIDFEWTIDIAERLCLSQATKQLMFQNVQLLIQRLLRGLENINASLRSCSSGDFLRLSKTSPTSSITHCLFENLNLLSQILVFRFEKQCSPSSQVM